MSEDQVIENIYMTPLERLDLAFKLSEFALDVRKQAPANEGLSSIQWIELHKVSSSR